MSLLARMARAPALHFAALGALLFAFAGERGAPAPEAAPRPPIVLGVEQVERLLERYARATGLRATRDDARALVDREVDDEVLYREALARGLDRGDRGVAWRMVEKMSFVSDGHDVDLDTLHGKAADLGFDQEDRVVRRILVEKMRLLLKHAAPDAAPDDAALAAYLARHRERFAHPARVRLSHVTLLRERHPGTLEADATRMRDALVRGAVPPEEARAHGDPFPMDRVGWLAGEREIAARFGAAFAEGVARAPAGAWSEPLPSAFGLHLVWVHERLPDAAPALADVRGRVLYGLRAEQREAALASNLRALRGRYDVRIDWPASLAPQATP
jgi:hypothetical protein